MSITSKQMQTHAWLACAVVAALLFSACGKQPPASNNVVNTEPPTSAPASITLDAVNNQPPESIDLSKYNADIERLENAAARMPDDDDARLALAKAYLSRAKAQAKARQYRPALDDCRRVLQFDPDNEEAPQLSAAITEALQGQGQAIPTEGNEPPPLGITPDTIAGGEDNPTAASSSTKEQSPPARKKGKQ